MEEDPQMCLLYENTTFEAKYVKIQRHFYNYFLMKLPIHSLITEVETNLILFSDMWPDKVNYRYSFAILKFTFM